MVINASDGLKQYQKMRFGIKPASAIFQGNMENTLKGILMIGVRTDGILISRKTDAEHFQNLEKVLQVIHDLGLTVNKEKCRFFLNEVEHLGHIIDKNGLWVNMVKVEAIKNEPSP